ncbi:MAG: DUF2267 domain-containing protein [Desulfobacteraceae bacterium]|nr:DUF2267 domain-containing protein [Desulfobacteraceae bacterium]
MHYREFVDRVRERAGLENVKDATIAVRATLGTLGERLHTTERVKLGAQLPHELKEMLGDRHDHDFFDLEEFYNRVSARGGIRYPHAVEQAGAVVAVLKEAVSPGELADATADLTEDYRELFGEKEKGPVSPSAA